LCAHGSSSLSNLSPCLKIFWGDIKKRKGQGCSDAIEWYDAWYKSLLASLPQCEPTDSKEYKVRGAHYCMHACMHAVCVPVDAAVCVTTDADA
jgi:hypothetical protein